ncbi:hypothetical protein Lnau_1839 [Legionella nautarum]|uniref:DUF211 domain-containing protein n=1 Tax=Legionella nautarum TaxID=45070 RepID=A0A0W0WS52_9GAMM|nr:DUF211 domain-containing protein [Legionella nautarum]KTD35168.1 hypothetical protein Lnau_1839 [Legionella nautarum]
MKIRRLILDVDKARERPTLLDITKALSSLSFVEAVNITVENIDIETVGTEVIIEGQDLNYEKIISTIEGTGAVVHSIDQIVAGERTIEYIPRARGR